ncbi:BrnA antitoxin family protein [Pantoea sp. 18069]|uniref:BrnA antitoxin family protein n=1 Tax=Pantoea sp. 18069 TaxID=2681415 RepID=UPI001357C3A9|nr:BrnA antitoxin family protein [Pantoea sp. 18069]
MPKLKAGHISPSAEEDAIIGKGIAADADNPEWTPEDFAGAKPAHGFFGPDTYQALTKIRRKPGERGAQKTATKVATTIRLSPEVSAAFRASGPGWQTRIDEALKDWLRTHRPA